LKAWHWLAALALLMPGAAVQAAGLTFDYRCDAAAAAATVPAALPANGWLKGSETRSRCRRWPRAGCA